MKQTILGIFLFVVVSILLVGAILSFIVGKTPHYTDKFNDPTYQIVSVTVKKSTASVLAKPKVASQTLQRLPKRSVITHWKDYNQKWVQVQAQGAVGYLEKSALKIKRESNITVVQRVWNMVPRFFENLKIVSSIKDSEEWLDIGAEFLLSPFKLSYWRIILLCFLLFFIFDWFFLNLSPLFLGLNFRPLEKKGIYYTSTLVLFFIVVVGVVAIFKEIPITEQQFIKIIFSPLPPLETKLISEWLLWIAGKLVPIAYILDVLRTFRSNPGKTMQSVLYSVLLFFNLLLLLITLVLSIPGSLIVLLFMVGYLVLLSLPSSRRYYYYY